MRDAVTTPAHEAAVMQVIRRETDTFVRQDLEEWATCWVQDERTRLVSASTSFGVTVLEGWEPLKRYMMDVFDTGSSCEIVDFQRTNTNITIHGDIAYVVFDGHSAHVDGRHEQTFETRVLEQSDGVWRILYASFIVRGPLRDDVHRIAVDAKGSILFAPESALASLRQHPGLQISNGRLRAKRTSWDKVLQASLGVAAQHHGFCQHYRFSSRHGKTFRLPVVLGESDDGEIALCTLFVRDGVTFVELPNEKDSDDRLAVAKTIFGLSDAQASLARHVIGGESLTGAADKLGISINTARTHLSRIYDKTGVNSQTALVRTLLSVG